MAGTETFPERVVRILAELALDAWATPDDDLARIDKLIEKAAEQIGYAMLDHARTAHLDN